MRKTTGRGICVFIFFLLAAPLFAQGEFWGELKAGPYGVGFRATYQADTARWYDADYPSPGKPQVKRPRPILIALWYPAPPDQGKAMVHRDYFRVLTLDSGAPEFAPRLRKFTHEQAALYMLGKEFDELSADERGRFDGLLATPVFAVLNAPAAEGRFPVVLYHPGLGGTYEDNAVACEFLASHGYVVVSSAYQPADSSELSIDGDLETSFADLAFLLRYAATLPFVDADKVAAMGHSYGAQAVLGWRAQPGSPLDAVVFLDSALEYTGFDAPQFAKLKAAVERNPKSSTPILLFADRERHPKFESFDPYLKFAPRYEVGTAALEHNAFVSQGAVVKEDDVRRRYEAVCDLALKFLDAYVRGDSDALKGLHAANVRYRQPAPVPPTGAQIARLYRSDASASAQSLLKAADAEALIGAASILFDDDEKKQGVELLKSAVRLLPRSAAVAEAFATALQQTGDLPAARTAYEKALSLLAGDETLTAEQKALLRDSITASLK